MSLPSGRPPNPWRVAVVAGMASYVDSAAIISFGNALVIYQHAIGLGPGQIGIASATLTFGIAVGALLGGALGDRFGRRPVFSATMLLIAAGATILAFSAAFPALLLGAVLLGLGTGGDLPVSLSMIAEAAGEDNRGRLIGFSQIMWIAGILAAIVLSMLFGNWGRLGAQLMFGHLIVVAVLILLARLALPESRLWQQANAARIAGLLPPAERPRAAELLRAPHSVPFLALVVFYSLVNLSANTSGQFGTYLLVNHAGVDVPTAAALALPFLPLGILGIVWYMAIADGRHRFTYFTVGAVLLVLGNLIPVFVEFGVATYLASRFVALAGIAFAGEAIMKTWTQESFPTLLRTSAQGGVIAVARLAAALMAAITPALISVGVEVLYGVVSTLCAIGLIVAWVVFAKRIGRSTFRSPLPEEDRASPAPEPNA